MFFIVTDLASENDVPNRIGSTLEKKKDFINQQYQSIKLAVSKLFFFFLHYLLSLNWQNTHWTGYWKIVLRYLLNGECLSALKFSF